MKDFLQKLPRWSWFVIVPVALLLIGMLVLGARPVQGDELLPEEEWGVGSSSVEPAWTGLLREWPETEDTQNVDLEQAELGYLLFFDPVLSGENTTACADCHHPDLGFSDGRVRSQNNAGAETARHAPSLWNAAYTAPYFWDGRAATLEAQAIMAIRSETELDQDPDELVDELSEIDAYAEHFDSLYDDGITVENIASALAEFERTLVSDGAAFDDYANGDREALTAQQRRGLATFRSAGSRCFECHLAPAFTDNTFRVTGAPDDVDDIGRGEFQEGADYAFSVPGLRNVALNAPYMHNGTFESLDEVIPFYATAEQTFTKGEVDRLVRFGVELTGPQIEDMVAFLYALTDETLPERFQSVSYVDDEGYLVIPDEVPSGLDGLITAQDNPTRDLVAEAAAAPSERPECQRDAEKQTITVAEGQTLQSAADCAQPGDTILVPPGIYHERIVIDTSGITLRGMVDQEPDMCPVRTEDGFFPSGDDRPNWPVLEGDIDGDGTSDLTDGVIASGNDFHMEYFIVQNFTGNGVLVEGVTGVTLRHMYIEDAGLYALYPVRSTNVLVECNIATLTTDAALYVGQSEDIIVRDNLVYDNVAGIEIENSYGAEVYNNDVWNNVGGILAFMLPNLHSRVSGAVDIHDNYVHDNNRPKGDAPPGSIVGLVPIGSGIFVMATDDSSIHNNIIENNDSFGVAIVSLYQAYSPDEIGDDVGPNSERNRVFDNTFINNGTNPDPAVADAGLPGADILWDAEGYGNTFTEADAEMFPPVLPRESTPPFFQRILFRIWNWLAHNL